MAHTFSANQILGSSGGVRTTSITLAANATVLTVNLSYSNATARTGGAPTYGGVALTQADTTRISGGVAAELWYYLMPPVSTALTLSIPNGSNLVMDVYWASFISDTGNSFFDADGGTATTGTNPAATMVTSLLGDLLCSALATSVGNFSPSGSSGTSFNYNRTTWGEGDQYVLNSGVLGTVSIGYTWSTSSSYAEVAVAFSTTSPLINIFTGSGGVVSQGSASDFSNAPPSPVVYYALPSERAVKWVGNCGVTGYTIPSRTNIYTTINPSGGNDTSALQNAINNCPQDSVIKLGSGVFSISSTLNAYKGVILRGNGKGVTIIRGTGGFSGSQLIQVTAPSGWSYTAASYPSGNYHSVSSARKGSRVVTVGSTSGLNVGSYVLLDQNNAGTVYLDPQNTGLGSITVTNNGAIGGQRQATRSLGQYNVVTAISGNNVTLAVPIYWNFDPALSPQLVELATPVSGFGIESLTLDNTFSGAGEAATQWNCVIESWMNNVECIASYKELVRWWDCYRCTMRGCTLHEGFNGGTNYPTSGGPFGPDRGYAVWFGCGASACLIENNEFYHVALVTTTGGCNSGNVFGYNYIHDLHHNSSAQAGSGFSQHGSHPYLCLYEGNYSQAVFMADNYWGSSSSNVLFRSKIVAETGYNSGESCFHLQTNQRWYVSLGNVLGTVGVENQYQTINADMTNFTIYDLESDNSGNILRHGTYDSVHNSFQWNGSDNQSLDASLYLTDKPFWWPGITSSMPNKNTNNGGWPPYGPTYTPGSSGTAIVFTPSRGLVVAGKGQLFGFVAGGHYTKGGVFIPSGGMVCNDIAGSAGVPSIPQNLVATGNTQQVRLQFDLSPGAVSYNLYWSLIPGVTVNNGTQIKKITDPYFHTGLDPSTTYYYVVTAVNTFGESPASLQVVGITPTGTIQFPNLPPDPPPASVINFPVVPLNMINRLPSDFDKESSPQKIFKITNANVLGVVIAPDYRSMTINKDNGSFTINIKDTKITSIKSALQANGMTLQTFDTSYDGLLNHTLTNDFTDPIQTNIHFETSLNIRFMNAIEQFLLDNVNSFLNGLNEIYFKLSDSEWLTLWCAYFGFDRKTGDSDFVLLTKTINAIIAIKLNNLGIMRLLLNELGLACVVTDYPGQPNAFIISFNSVNVSTLPQPQIDKIIDLVNLYRAAGCFPVYVTPGSFLKTNIAGETTNNLLWGTYPLVGTGIVVTLTHS